MSLRLLRRFGRLAALALAPVWASAALAPAYGSAFTNLVSAADLDPQAFRQWVDGTESPMPEADGPKHTVWTRESTVQWSGSTFGAGRVAGPRHLRVGFRRPVAPGSVLVRGGGQLSVLKPEAPYPGDLANDAQWQPAERLAAGEVTRREVNDDTYALWLLPTNTATRALRFTHVADLTDKTYQGFLGGVWLLRERLVNVAPQALAISARNPQRADRLNNGGNDGTWGTWDNWEETAPNEVVVSPEHPDTILLVWPQAMPVAGLCALWAGFGSVEVQGYAGPAERHPREARDQDWQTLRRFSGLENYYPLQLGPNWLDFGQVVTNRALRLRLTGVTREGHPHLNGNTKQGRRVWLGEILALMPLGSAPLRATVHAGAAVAPPPHPPIAVRFKLKQPGIVTLVIDAADGRRVRNLVSETPFPAGQNTAWWDGMDDLGRDPDAANHGIYHVPGAFVEPGTYRVRGLVRQALDLRYEFAVYDGEARPPWNTADNTGAWLSNHTPPSGVLYIPGNRTRTGQPWIYIGSHVSEGTHGLAWVDLEGRKVGGQNWVGGNWTGAPYLAYDAATNADRAVSAFAGSTFENELRLTALTAAGEKSVLKHAFAQREQAAMSGLAVQGGRIVVSLPKLNQLLLVDAAAGAVRDTVTLDDPRGLAFDRRGRLLALSGSRLLRGQLQDGTLAAAETVVAAGLDDPQQVVADAEGNLYVSDRGRSHQVKVFDESGRFVRAVGKAGVPQAGPYDELRMNNPSGLTIDSRRRLWVAETDYAPKRVSLWNLDPGAGEVGAYIKAFYGPAEYGGGGSIDSGDRTIYNYHGMAFRLDWAKGTYKLERVFYRPGAGPMPLSDKVAVPETAFYRKGRKYYANCFNGNPTGGSSFVLLWIEREGLAVPAAAMGRGHDWELLKTEPFRARWPQGIDPAGDYWRNQSVFLWSDTDGDGVAQPSEVVMAKSELGGTTVMPDLALVNARLGGNAVRLAPQGFTEAGVPRYDLAKAEVLVTGVEAPRSSGGDQALVDPAGWTVLSLGVKPLSPFSLCGVYQGVARWSYPSPWPGLHASHTSPAPERPGELIGTTRLLGPLFTPRKDVGPLWCINGNQGNIYVFTVDGLFVATLFHDVRQGKSWSMPSAPRNMLLNAMTLHDENFWPSVTQTRDGKVYLVDGARTSIVRVEGMDSLRRLPDQKLAVTVADLQGARDHFVRQEALRQQEHGQAVLTVAVRPVGPVVDGVLDDWAGADWATIDKRGVAAYFDANTKPYDVAGAVAVSADRLYAAFRTGDANLLSNSGATPQAPFKTGGALDLMIGASPAPAARGAAPVAGDVRLLVTRVKERPLALVYRAVVADGAKDPVPFSSPWRTITFDRVDTVSDQVQLAGKDGNYELSIPLAALELRAAAGTSIQGDLGILRGDGFNTVQRVYWMNKATGITADVPSEAELTPSLWGRWDFKAPDGR